MFRIRNEFWLRGIFSGEGRHSLNEGLPANWWKMRGGESGVIARPKVRKGCRESFRELTTNLSSYFSSRQLRVGNRSRETCKLHHLSLTKLSNSREGLISFRILTRGLSVILVSLGKSLPPPPRERKSWKSYLYASFDELSNGSFSCRPFCIRGTGTCVSAA